MRVVIVSKTKMHGGICIGGIIEATVFPVRIIPPGCANNPLDTPFNIGEIWELDLKPRANLTPPHVEDHDFTSKAKVGEVADLKNWILGEVAPWRGGPEALFGGALKFRPGYSAYVPISDKTVRNSTGFWLLPYALDYAPFEDGARTKPKYRLAGPTPLVVPCVGVALSISNVPGGSLVRVSLAHPWTAASAPPDEDKRLSLQLSGWY